VAVPYPFIFEQYHFSCNRDLMITMNLKYFFPVIIAAIALCICIAPASAVIQEVTLKGTVSAISPEENTITIANVAQYGCDYPAGGAPVCTFTPIDSMPVTGSVPDSTALSTLAVGDTAVATSRGGTGGSWITLARLYGPGVEEEYVTDIFGDPDTVPVPLVGDYALGIAMKPDCTTCSLTTCTAASAAVTVKSSGMTVAEKTLAPRMSFFYNGRNDGSSVAVTFVHGEASPMGACPAGSAGATGPQPLSVFIVDVQPPIGFAPAATVTTAAAVEATPTPQ
jgi:hypothetical protein